MTAFPLGSRPHVREQLLLPRPNGCDCNSFDSSRTASTERTFGTCTVGSDSYIVYASGNKLLICSGDFELLQRLEPFANSIESSEYISTLAVHPEFAWVAVSCKSSVACFAPSIQQTTNNSHSSNSTGSSLLPNSNVNQLLQSESAHGSFTSTTEKNAPQYVEWHIVSTLAHPDTVTSLSWSSQGMLLVGGKTVVLWNTENILSQSGFKKIQELQLAQPVASAQFSPQGDYFSTLGSNDCLPKIWYYRQKRSGFTQSQLVSQSTPAANDKLLDFVYLCHYGPVSTMEWRWPASSAAMEANSNTILTIAEDGICRIWSQLPTLSTGFVLFTMSLAIDTMDLHIPSSAPSPVVSSYVTEADTLEAAKNKSMETENLDSENQICAVHWLTGSGLATTHKLRDKLELRFLMGSTQKPVDVVQSRSKRLADTLVDYPDMLFCVLKSGAVVIWGIQNLSCKPVRTPKLIVVMRTEQTINTADYDLFQGPLQIFCDQQSLCKSAIYFPAELSLLVQRRSDGVLACFTMNLDDFFTNAWTAPRFHLVYTWSGHSCSVESFIRHPGLPYVITTDSSGLSAVYKSSPPRRGLQTVPSLQHISFLRSIFWTHPKAVCWMPNSPIIAATTPTEIAFFKIDLSPYTCVGKLDLDAVDSLDLILLHAFRIPPEKNSDSNYNDALNPHSIYSTIHLLGVSALGVVYLWVVFFKESVVISTTLVSKSSLSIDAPIHSASVSSELVYFQSPYQPIGSHVFQTVLLDGRVLRWHCDQETLPIIQPDIPHVRQNMSWIMVSQFDLRKNADLGLVSADPFGKLAAVTQSSTSTAELTVWSIGSSGLNLIPEWSETLNERVKCIDWFLSSDGQSHMAVGLQSKVAIYIQERLASTADMPKWTQISCIKLEFTDFPKDEIQTVAWLAHGSIFVSTKLYSAIYSKWIDIASDKHDLPPLNMFKATSALNGRFPDHHPKLLIQYLMWGQYDNVKYILSMLHRFSKLCIDAGRPVPDVPIPLWKLFCDTDPTVVPGSPGSPYPARKLSAEDLFSDTEFKIPHKTVSTDFTPEDAADLLKLFSTCRMPHMSENDHDILLGVIDSFAQLAQCDQSLDQNGIRYVLFLKLLMHSKALAAAALKEAASAIRILDGPSKPQPTTASNVDALPLPRLTNRDITWAFMSDCQDTLVQIVTNLHGGKLYWSDAKDIGLGLWLTDPSLLKSQFECIARNQYLGRNDSKDPVNCSLFYLALKKKNVLLGLWRLAVSHQEQAAMLRFLANDFNDDRWRQAALKNAFALLGKQRYEYAAAFFLLAGNLKDAAYVCIKQLNDIQLAIALVRVYEGEDGPVLNDLVLNTLVPDAIEKGDRWLVFILYYLLKKRDLAFYATVMPLETLVCTSSGASSNEINTSVLGSQTGGGMSKIKNGTLPDRLVVNDPALLILYKHLQERLKTIFMIERPSITPELEMELFYSTAQAYERLGCPALALHVIQSANLLDMPMVEIVSEYSNDTGFASNDRVDSKNNRASLLPGNDPTVPESNPVLSKSSDFDWGEPEITQPKATSAAIDWSEMESTKPAASGGIDWGEMEPVHSNIDDELDRELAALNDQLSDDIVVEEADPKPVVSLPVLGLETKKVILQLTQADWLKLVLHRRSIKTYAWILVMRVLQSIYSSVTIVSDYKATLKIEPVFSDYFSYVRQGITALRHIASLPGTVMDRILSHRCREMNALIAFMELAPLHGHVAESNMDVSEFMVQEANTLAHIAFTEFATDTTEKFLLLDQISIRLLRSFDIWNEKAGESVLSNVVVCQTSVTSFIILTMTSLFFKKYNRVWWILGMCDQLFEVLLKGNDRRGLGYLIHDLLADREPIAHPDGDQDELNSEEEELFDEFGLPLYRAGSPCVLLAESLIQLLVLRQVCLVFEHYLERVKEVINVHVGMDQAHGFLADSVMKGISRYIFYLQQTVTAKWASMDFKPEINMRSYLHETELNPLWDLFRHTFDVRKMIQDVAPPTLTDTLDIPNENESGGMNPASLMTINTQVHSGGTTQADPGTPRSTRSTQSAASTMTDAMMMSSAAVFEPQLNPTLFGTERSEVVFRSGSNVTAFAINPMNLNEMVVSTHKNIREINLQLSCRFYESKECIGDRVDSVDDLSALGNIANAASNGLSGDASPVTPSSTPPLGIVEFKGVGSKLADVNYSLQAKIGTTQKMLRRAFTSNRLTRDDRAQIVNGEALRRRIPGVTAIESHLSLNYYLATTNSNHVPGVNLYQFGQSTELVTYTVPSELRLTACHFDPFGVRFGAADTKGDLFMWRFDTAQSALRPALILRQCHLGPVNDFVFMNSTTTLATAGISTNNSNVCMWDTLVPPSKSKIKSFQIGEAGISSLEYSPRHNLLIVGGKRGYIYVIDVRQGASVVNTFHAHNHAVKALAIDPITDTLISGSSGGQIKIWDVQALGNAEIMSASRGTIATQGTYSNNGNPNGSQHHGVLSLTVHSGLLYSSAVDGSVSRTLLPTSGF
ncbi:hypothetical protein BDEG_22865 [Batrachochytrium dendrobatidis JEL423]|nr:hypothetical protein BDEG_22865 [Batrachochytrium dendrobatidis JEL423]